MPKALIKFESKTLAAEIIKLRFREPGTVPSISMESLALMSIVPDAPELIVAESILPPFFTLSFDVLILRFPACPPPKVEAVMPLGRNIFCRTPFNSIKSASTTTSPPLEDV
ncbi:MAG: hypothetical protein CLLPBCKN_008444 [Chroococcidiopsis cubana SAG 39.79]|uniref:Uncharacterized protein n=1 Tax=Chroococcidiopsis cubana SAG 39.79 TaxID=388085 RepID=A0AB37U9B3_9CYAN|nr:hypothetical protein [Chroococcidiopsis cubana]MDZ4879006.1 hypothetical protein [Chroococcidiopsis cubana SAG 39.79]RUT01410.1 hypothetical protein DSM107010_65380 [Chroococcidiopsis cubana SAG 39.79]